MGSKAIGNFSKETKVILSIGAIFVLAVNLPNSMAVPICDEEYQFRSIDGTCNNLENPLYGSAGIELLRVSQVGYNDGVSEPADFMKPNPREISNQIASQSDLIPNEKKASDFIWQWGQFLDHDIDLTTQSFEPLHITVPKGDTSFDPDNTGTQIIPFFRSNHNGGDSLESPRQQINEITSFIDASNVYGSYETLADSLRESDSAKLKTSEGNLLPEDNIGFFVAGDVRANEQIGLTSMHTLFVREHNRIVDETLQKYPEMDNEQVYQIARKIVGAEIQSITYNEFLPLLIGNDAIPVYDGYDPSINPAISNEFSTAAYRYGHSQLAPNLLTVDEHGAVKYVPLRNAFFNPEKFKEIGIDAILRGLAAQRAQEIDNKLVDDVRNFLFGEPGQGGLDLASLNIQRGRDHGIPDYNTVRVAFGLAPVEKWEQISSDPKIQEGLKSLYGDINRIDLWIGILAEDHVTGAMVGETARAVLIDQFTRLRDGDRFWYQNDPFFTDYKDYMKNVEKSSLSDIIKRNTGIGGELQVDAFHCKNLKWMSEDKKHFCH